MKIGFVGLGHMGDGMARRLIAAGNSLIVYNRTRSRAEPLRSLGADIAADVRDAAAHADILITMLADDAAVEDVVFSPGGVLQNLRANAVHVSMSTISVDLSRRLTKAHRDKDQTFVSATVFGRPDAAAAGKLFVVIAGPRDEVARCEPLLNAIGQRVFDAGDEPANANVIKLAGNFMITAVIESLSESFAFVEKHGVEPRVLLDVLTGSLFSAPIYSVYGNIIVGRRFDPPGFKMPLGMKDNGLVLAAAQAANVPMPLASLVRDQFITAMATGLGELDWSAVSDVSYRNAGIR